MEVTAAGRGAACHLHDELVGSLCSEGRLTSAHGEDRVDPLRRTRTRFSSSYHCVNGAPFEPYVSFGQDDLSFGWQPARRLATAAVWCVRGSWPIDNRPQLTKLPHKGTCLAYTHAQVPVVLSINRAGLHFVSSLSVKIGAKCESDISCP